MVGKTEYDPERQDSLSKQNLNCQQSINHKRTGRPAKLEHHHKRTILKVIRSESKTSAPNLANTIDNDYGIKVVPQTIRNVLKNAGYNSRPARRKPFISKINKQKCIDFAKVHMNKATEFWHSVIFSDECKFNVFGSDERAKVWRKKNTQMECKNLRATIEHGGGSVLVWGCRHRRLDILSTVLRSLRPYYLSSVKVHY